MSTQTPSSKYLCNSSHTDSFYFFSHCCFLSYFEGLVTIVPCSPIAGLEICDHETQTWTSVENELELTPFRDLIVFPGRTLQILTNDYYIGTRHRVGKNSEPRLSLVYELRAKAALNLDTFLVDLQQQQQQQQQQQPQLQRQ
jgi:isopenicillin N synthase-like dioxygenase